MAHIREKCSALDGDIEDLSDDMRIAEMETQAVSKLKAIIEFLRLTFSRLGKN